MVHIKEGGQPISGKVQESFPVQGIDFKYYPDSGELLGAETVDEPGLEAIGFDPVAGIQWLRSNSESCQPRYADR